MTVGQVDDAAVTAGVSHPGSVSQAVKVLLDGFRYAGQCVLANSYRNPNGQGQSRATVQVHALFVLYEPTGPLGGLWLIGRALRPAETTSGPWPRLPREGAIGGSTHVRF